MTNAYTAIRSAEGVPTWDLKDSRSDYVIGFMTNFPGEGPIATVRLHHGDDGVTVSGKTLHSCLYQAREAYEALYDEYECGEEHIEDEDGEIAYIKMLERRGEEFSGRDDMQEPIWN